LNRIYHQEFLKRYKFCGIEALGHNKSPGRAKKTIAEQGVQVKRLEIVDLYFKKM
jgi:hypothetical protein